MKIPENIIKEMGETTVEIKDGIKGKIKSIEWNEDGTSNITVVSPEGKEYKLMGCYPTAVKSEAEEES